MEAGSRIGPFELREIIGRGGMGEVWRARDTRLLRDVALKTLPPEFAADPRRIARLRREAQLLATLSHPNIAAILGLEEQDGICWLVIELVEGPTLEDRLASGTLALREATAIALQVAEAMGAAHSRGIVHCDLKPANIKLSGDGRVKVLDFGISRSLQMPAEPQASTLTALPGAGELAGTPAYMSPEQARGDPVGPTSDIWSFGVLLYRMLAGELPFAGPTTADTLAQVLQSDPDLKLLRSRAPEPLIRLLRRCLEKEPRKRIQHAGDLRVLIEEASVAGAPRRFRRRRLAACVAAAMALLAGFFWFLRDRPSSQTTALSPPAYENASIAVLPFVNMSADPEQEYFSDGLSEELINQLAHIEGLRVTARTSAFSFKGKPQNLRAVGQALAVSHLLEGSVRKSGGHVRITAQLIDASTGYHVWSETFDRTVEDVFAIQDEIATAVARRLGASLGVVPSTADYGGTRSLAAYDHLLRGLAGFALFTPEALRRAIDEYRTALDIDPTYARAAAELALAMGAASATGLPITLRERDEATATANRLAPDAPLTHVANMWLQSDRHHWKEADDSCKAVFALGRDPRAEWVCAGFLTLTGRVSAAAPFREAGRKYDPFSVTVASTLIRHYVILGMARQMQRELARAEALPGWQEQAGMELLVDRAHAGASQAEMSEQLARACLGLRKNACDTWTAAIRDPQHASSLLRAQLQTAGESSPANAGTVALAAAYVGDEPLALDALEVFTARAGTPSFQILWYPLLSNVRKDARFRRLMRDIGFYELWRSTGEWPDFCHAKSSNDFECS